jgi:predicted nucleic acid-binding protein
MRNASVTIKKIMSKNSLFLDSSALFAGIVSADGAARVLLMLAEAGQVNLLVSEQVIAETERAIARKAPAVLNEVRQTILLAMVKILPDPEAVDVSEHLDWMSDPADVPILLAAMQGEVGFLVTLNRRHFIDDAQVAQRSGLRIGTPGDALAWVRGQLA